MENGSTPSQSPSTLNSDGSEDRGSQEAGGEDALREGTSFLPKNVARRVFGSDAAGTPRVEEGCGKTSRSDVIRLERTEIVAAGFLPELAYLRTIDAKGTEHSVRFRGRWVEKHQHGDGWVPVITPQGKIGLDRARPTEYLRRLDLQNELFGDDIKIIGLTRGQRFAITQTALRGIEPSEKEITELLKGAGWNRVPLPLQDLPIQLMGSAWWHREEELILLDARKPNFKKTNFGVLPIDLILADLSASMRDLLE